MIDWDAVGAIGQLIGALGVIVSIGYLAMQIRRNTDAVQGSTVQAIFETHQFELRWASDIADVNLKVRTDPGTLTAVERERAYVFFVAVVMARQNEFFQYRRGLIDDEVWRASERFLARGFLQLPHVRDFWSDGFLRQVLQPEFAALMDGLFERHDPNATP